MVRMMVLLGAAALMLQPAQAMAKGQTKAQALDEIGLAFAAINDKEPERALTIVEPVLAGFEKDFANEKRHIYCSETPEQEGYYLNVAEGGADNVRLVDPKWCRAQFVRAFALVDLKRLDEAQKAFERLIGYAPQHARYLNEYAYVFLAKKEWQHSIDIYTRAEAAATFTPDRRDEERCVAFRGIGYDLVELGRLDDAEAMYRKCLAIIPDEPKSLGEIEYIKEQRKKAV